MGRLAHHTNAGWTYFVTTNSFQGTFLFQVQQTAEIIIAKILEYRDRQNFLLHDFVLMPNHLHLVVTPAPGVSLEKAMQLVKGGSSHEIHRPKGPAPGAITEMLAAEDTESVWAPNAQGLKLLPPKEDRE